MPSSSEQLEPARATSDSIIGTSSRSTKLVHGGVRYLEKAVRELDYEQYQLVREALHERKNFLTIAPHLSYELPIMIPVYRLESFAFPRKFLSRSYIFQAGFKFPITGWAPKSMTYSLGRVRYNRRIS